MTIAEIETLINDFAKAATLAVAAGVDVVEVHVAHGYLLHQFLSPITNRRQDKYGGSFENRTRVVIEVIQAVRAAMLDTIPIFVRISATDWMEETEQGKRLGSWTLDDTIRFAKLLPDLGVDVLDVSSGGICPGAEYNVFNAGQQQSEMAGIVRKALAESGKRLLIGAVGEITESKQAHDLVQDVAGDQKVDLISVGRAFLRDPSWVMKVGEDLDVDVAWPAQVARPQIVKSRGKG